MTEVKSDTRRIYGDGRWTYGEFTFGLRYNAESIYAFLDVAEAQYFWGAGWWYATTKYPAKISPASFTVTVGRQVIIDETEVRKDLPHPSGRVQSGSVMYWGDATYTFSGAAVMFGPYWEETRLVVPSETWRFDLKA
ncbi:hypothetical protein [Streptomyces varsoviensis]|uniref:Uncharacterized protein n=1 Tax=Streptomyces varsoviensis TaxID=67373 RepID=A0ABR5IVM7_9ACTN|nr:hypothetical protein [Streptomyces varsoviensis]KOG85192.1 hypothetical protein ADK38_38015 [Streptomyces varsoviensis]